LLKKKNSEIKVENLRKKKTVLISQKEESRKELRVHPCTGQAIRNAC
jgi:hypothetical protein